MELVKNELTNWNQLLDDVRSGRIKCREGFECRECFGSGFREVADPKGSHYRGVVRCTYCEHWNFQVKDAA